MSRHQPPTDQELYEIEALACDATRGPWEAQVHLDYQRGESTRVVVHLPPTGGDPHPVVDGDRELADGDHRYIAGVHPDAVLRLVREIRRLRRMEERYETVRSVLEHLDAFLERRGLVAQAQRFVEVRAQLETVEDPGTARAGKAVESGRRAPTPAV